MSASARVYYIVGAVVVGVVGSLILFVIKLCLFLCKEGDVSFRNVQGNQPRQVTQVVQQKVIGNKTTMGNLLLIFHALYIIK